MFDAKVLEALNNQVNCEAEASNAYLAIASWSCVNSYHGSSKFFYAQSTAERQHMMQLFDYISQAGGFAKISQVAEPKTEFSSLKSVFEEASRIEEKISESLNQLTETALNAKDYSTFTFLRDFLLNQHEEDHFVNSIIDMLSRVGNEGSGIMMVDQEIGKHSESH